MPYQVSFSKIICLLIPVLFAIQLQAQHVDSLKDALKPIVLDTNRVNTLNSLCWEYRLINSDSALLYGNEALNLAGKVNFKKGEAHAKCNIGIAYAFKSDYKNAERFLNESFEYFKNSDQSSGMASVLFGLAFTYERWGDFAKALDYYLQALQIREKEGNKKSVVQILISISNLYYFIHDYDRAISYANRALSANREIDNVPINNVRILCSIGNIYTQKGEYERALEYHKNSLTVARSLNKLYTIIALCNIVHNYLGLNKYREAKPYVEEALGMTKDVGSVEITAQVLRYSAMVLSKENYYIEAIRNYEEALILAKSINSITLIIDCYYEAAKIYAHTGNYRKAFKYSHVASVMNDSLHSKEVSEELARVQKEHELVKKQTEIDLLTQKNKVKELEFKSERNWKYGLMVGSGLLLFFVAFASYGFVLKTRLNKKLNGKYVEVQKQKELIESININLHTQALRATMNPHFIFNALTSIQYLIATNNGDDAFNYLAKFSVLLRNVLDQGAKSTITLNEEIKFLKLYIELEALRFDHSLQYEIDLPDQIKVVPIPSMIIQPFVENALIHGLFNKRSDRRLDIKLRQDQMKIICQVKDNGVGRAAALKVKASKGLFNKSHSMELIKQRMEIQNNLNNGCSHYKIDDLVDETGNPSGTCVTITFDYV